MALAIFDLDNTLIAGDSDHGWGEFLVEQGLVDAKVYQEKNDYYFEQYQSGELDILEYLSFSLTPLTEYSLDTLHKLREQFVKEKILPIITQKSRDLLAKHRAQGDYLLIITATNLFVTEPIAQELGVDHIIATEPEFKNGEYTGRVAGIPSFQEGKVKRLTEWLEQNALSLQGSYFYSDSHNDLPLLKIVEHPVAVDADETLTQHAQEKNWPIISLRD
ncbi:HAD family hydrolase [Bermanella marisrubri]|uniref:Histidinol-phosphatase n=1 Tax=Bermanella marisrubri TaxID=207949 RepID=Q1N4F2_9GAMM|nr:HAD family hydrolase [Bermanella marisrubri]EAT12913.1 Phosphoserine phosphatase [Oceanobacter sp. RED65] [Bermanella marisrubri]QIZ82955.1 HAD family hydrolase [Bermanella marisrubri]